MRTPRFMKYLMLAVLADISNIVKVLRSAVGRILTISVIDNLKIKIIASLISIGTIVVFISFSITINWYSGGKEPSPHDPSRNKVEEEPLSQCTKGCLEINMLDLSGKQITARFYYTINRSGNWKIGDADNILYPNRELVPFSAKDLPMEVLKRSKFIFTIGAASFNEQCPGKSGIEEDRAMARARKMAAVIKNEIGSTPEVRTLSLGKYMQPPDMDEQRPAIVVAVISSDPGAKIPEAIMLALDNAFDQYSKQTGSKVIAAKYYSLVKKGNIEFSRPADSKAPLSSCY